MVSLQLLHELVLQRVRCDAGGIGHCGVDGSEGARGEREKGAGGGRAEEIAAASAQDSEGGCAGKHQGKVMRVVEIEDTPGRSRLKFVLQIALPRSFVAGVCT